MSTPFAHATAHILHHPTHTAVTIITKWNYDAYTTTIYRYIQDSCKLTKKILTTLSSSFIHWHRFPTNASQFRRKLQTNMVYYYFFPLGSMLKTSIVVIYFVCKSYPWIKTPEICEVIPINKAWETKIARFYFFFFVKFFEFIILFFW